MRIKTDGKHEYREDLYRQAGELLGERTKSGGIDAACEFTRRMIRNLERAADHPDMTADLADVLSTSRVRVEYEIQTGLQLPDD